ncbi:MAG: dockerin type I domain-containing protein [Candidatus Methanoplasma sp.]|nr:dockerin type I domain-containing protein [Candidatus Methanoplasma sp.]
MKAKALVLLAAMLMAAAALAALPQIGESDAYPDGAILIGSPQDLAKIGNDPDYPLNGKYFQTQDIDFTGIDLNGGFDVILQITTSNNAVTEVRALLSDGTQIQAIVAVVSVNGEVSKIESDIASWSGSAPFDPSEAVCVSIGGAATNSHPSVSSSADKNFAIAFSGSLPSSGSVSITENSNGNFTPIGGSDGFSGSYDGGSHRITNLETAVFGDAGHVYSGLFSSLFAATVSGLGIDGGYSVAVSASSSAYYAYAGGVAGRMLDSASVSDCYNAGFVFAFSFSGFACAGGVVGEASGSVSGCYNTGDVSASASSGFACAGGVAGYAWGSVAGCYNTGSVSASSSAYYACAGVVAGGASGSVSVSGCYNTGSVSASSTYNACAGGVAGEASGSVSGCYNTGDVSASSSSSSGFACAGGVAGEASDSASVSDCYNTGSVSASSSSYAYAGGIVGRIDGGSVSGCYNTGSVSASSSASYAYAGGVVGEASGSATVSDCFFLLGSVIGSEGLGSTEAVMKARSTYLDAGWDFADTWGIDPGVNGGYPYLLAFDYTHFRVTLVQGSNFTLSPHGGSASPVEIGGSYSFTLSPADGYSASDFIVKANGAVLSPADGVYTISDIRSDQLVTAEYHERTRFDVSVLSGEGGSVYGGGTFSKGERIEIRAEPDPGYRFVQWGDGSTDAVRTVTVTGAATYVAEFEPHRVTGDADGNGRVDSSDLLCVMMYLGEALSADSVNLGAMDVNRDGRVDVNDMIIVMMYLAEMIDSLEA